MTYSEVLAANFESGTWIMYDSKLLSLENLYPRQSVDPDASMERDTWMNRTKQLRRSLSGQSISITRNPRPEALILLNLNGVETSTNAQNAQVEESLLCAGGVHEPHP